MRIEQDNNTSQNILFGIGILLLIAAVVAVFFTMQEDVAEEPRVLLPGDVYSVGGTIKTQRYVAYGGRSQDGESLVFYEKYGTKKTRLVPAKVGTSFTALDAHITIQALDANAEAITITDVRDE